MNADSPNSALRVLDDGFTVLSDGGKNPNTDIVFIHGLGGHPRSTWSASAQVAQASGEPQPRASKQGNFHFLRRLVKRPVRPTTASEANKSSTKTRDQGSKDDVSRPASAGSGRQEARSSRNVFWPEDLLARDFQNARVLTFGYTSDPRAPVKHNLYTLSTNLLSRLADKRVDNPARPIIFICHSLGGILTKFALKISLNASGANEHLRTIRQSTRAIFFFATPHAGSQLASVGELLTRISGLFTVTNTTLLAALNAENDSGQLEELRIEFGKMLGSPRDGGLKVVNFRETKPISTISIGPTARQVVPLASAEITSQWAENLTMVANHRDICKFKGYDDPKYQDFKAVLTRYIAEIAKSPGVDTAEGRNTRIQAHTESHIHVVNDGQGVTKAGVVEHFETLSSMNINQHLYEVQSADGQSFQWISKHHHFITTLNPCSSTIFHITGKPGCGKSVLSKLMYELLRNHEEYHSCTLFFAFNERDNLRRNSVNMMASLVAQFVNLFGITGPAASHLGPNFNQGAWTERTVSKIDHLFYSMMTSVPPNMKVIVVVDGLDECAPLPDRGQLLSTLSRIVNDTQHNFGRVSFLVTSRPDSGIMFGNTPMTLDLNSEESLDKDLNAYIVTSVNQLVSTRTGLWHYRERIIAKLQRRADKMYLLVKLLLDLMRDHPVSSPAAFETLLSSLPETLSAIYDRIWSLIPQRDEPRAKMIFSWILCAFRPLTVQEFSIGMARHDYDNAMKVRYAECWRLEREARFDMRSHLQNPLELANTLEWYTPMDFEGDVTRLLGPLIHISHSVGDRSMSPMVMLCHQSVKEHFLELPGFLDISQVHHQMAEVCARQSDATITGDPDAIPVRYHDTATTFGSNTTPYSEFWYHHSKAIADANPLDLRKVYFRQMVKSVNVMVNPENVTKRKWHLPQEGYDLDWVEEILEADGWDSEWAKEILEEGRQSFVRLEGLMKELWNKATSSERKMYIQHELSALYGDRAEEILQKGRKLYPVNGRSVGPGG